MKEKEKEKGKEEEEEEGKEEEEDGGEGGPLIFGSFHLKG